jgi:hypothetical protein
MGGTADTSLGGTAGLPSSVCYLTDRHDGRPTNHRVDCQVAKVRRSRTRQLSALSHRTLAPNLEKYILDYRNGRDISQLSRGMKVIDLDGLAANDVRKQFPAVYQHVHEYVKPERDQNNEKYRREHWWLFGRKNTELRAGLLGLIRYIATPETAKHRYFVFCDRSIRPDNKLVCIASADSYVTGVLSSKLHVQWALAAGGRLGVGNDPVYVKTTCFECFPFPDASDPQKAKIRELGEQLDAHRKRQQVLHPTLTMTGMYNVLEKLRAGETLTAKEKTIHEQGLVSVLKQIHDDLVAAVADAYGWPVDLSDEEILERLVALNHERAEEERRGIIRYLRPEFQNPPRPNAKANRRRRRSQRQVPSPQIQAPQKTHLAQSVIRPGRRRAVGARFNQRPRERGGCGQAIQSCQQRSCCGVVGYAHVTRQSARA